MALTETFGFSMFGGSQGGDISDDGYKFSIRDRQMFEALFVRLLGHKHTAEAALADPTTPPALTLGSDVTASIPAGTALFYRVSYLDAYGGETAASEEYTISTPDPLDPPDTPAALAVAGGSLPNGATYYLVTFYQDAGGETEPSNSTVVTIVGSSGDQKVDLALPAIVTGADGWRIYKRGPNQASFYFLVDQPVASGTSYLDDGTVAIDATRPVSSVNDTNSNNKVTVTAPLVAGVVPTGVAKWRIYRSFESGVYADQSLVHEVTERVDEMDPLSALVTTWDDLGDALFDGIPLDISNCVGDAPVVDAGVGTTAGVTSVNSATGAVVVGNVISNVVAKTAAYSAAAGDLVLANATTAAFNVTLPAVSAKRTVVVKKVDSSANAVTVVPPAGGATIDGASTNVLGAQWLTRTYVSDGTNYFVI